MSAWKELDVRSSTAYPTEVAASLVLVLQSPAAGFFVPSATFVDVDVEGEGVVTVGLPEQAATKAKVATSTTGATAIERRGRGSRIGAILCGSLGPN
jgi:hypothetical protein